MRTHYCSWCFLTHANWERFVADTRCFWTKSETFLCPGHKICVCNKCCAHRQTGKHLCQPQCVCNNVSSFATTLTLTTLWIVCLQLPLSDGNSNTNSVKSLQWAVCIVPLVSPSAVCILASFCSLQSSLRFTLTTTITLPLSFHC